MVGGSWSTPGDVADECEQRKRASAGKLKQDYVALKPPVVFTRCTQSNRQQ